MVLQNNITKHINWPNYSYEFPLGGDRSDLRYFHLLNTQCQITSSLGIHIRDRERS